MRMFVAAALLLMSLTACKVEHKVTLSSEECEKLQGAERDACMRRLEDAIEQVSEEIEETRQEIDKAAAEIERSGDEIGERMERVGEAMQSSEPAPPPAPRP